MHGSEWRNKGWGLCLSDTYKSTFSYAARKIIKIYQQKKKSYAIAVKS